MHQDVAGADAAPAVSPDADVSRADEPPRQTMPRGWRLGVLLLVALVYVVMSVTQAREDSLTVDEAPDLAAGLSEWQLRDARINPEHGLLPHLAQGLLPTLLADPVVPEGESWESGDWFTYTDELVQANDEAGRLDRVLFLARLQAVVLGLLTALAVHALARRWAGPTAALLAAVAWLTTPLVVGMHHLVSIDPATALAVLVVALTSIRLVEAPSTPRAVVAGLALGALLLTRHAGLALVPIPLVVAAIGATTPRERARRVLVVALVALVTVWGTYRAVDPSGPTGDVRAAQQGLVASASAESLTARAIGTTPLPLEWRAGYGYLELSSGAKVSGALGQRWEGGRWWYYPVSLGLASPPLTLALLGLAPFVLLGWSAADRTRRRDLAICGATAALSLAPLLLQQLQLGPRLLLPVLAIGLAVGAGGAEQVARRLRAGPGVRRAVGAVLVAAQVALLVGSGPSSFGWTMPGLRPEHRWAGPQATDLGQDRDRVADWAADHEDVVVDLLTPLGQEPPAGTTPLDEVDPDELTGWVAVSVSSLVTFGPELSWLRAHCNVDAIGRSVLVYRFDEPPSRALGPDLPVASCTDDEVSTRR